jgi:gas vesicle protein
MDHHNQENGKMLKNIRGFGAGLLVGGLAGAGAVLLLAPQSGKKTRAQIQQKSIELRDETVTAVEGAVAQVRGKARQIADSGREQAGELQQRGQDVIDEQKDHLSETLTGLGKAVHA